MTRWCSLLRRDRSVDSKTRLRGSTVREGWNGRQQQ